MPIESYREVEPAPVTMTGAKDVTMRVVIGPKQGAPNFIMRVFEMRPGGHSPRHRHDYEHEIFVHRGTGEIFCDGKTYPVEPGHYAFIAPNLEHQVLNTGQEPLLFVCLIPNIE